MKVAIKGMKYDGDKPRMALLFDGMPRAIEGVASVLTFGAKKYADHSWQHVDGAQERYSAALLRHQLAISKGEINDPESGLPHAYHVACNALFLAEFAALAVERAQCSERAAGAEPVQRTPRPADDSRGDGELVGDARAVGGGVVGTAPVAGSTGGAVADHGSGVRRVSELAQQLKQRLACNHAYTFEGYTPGGEQRGGGYFDMVKKFKCIHCGSIRVDGADTLLADDLTKQQQHFNL